MRTVPASIRTAIFAIALSIPVTVLLAQTAVKPPKNRYTPQQDVDLGRKAADEVRQQYPIVEDESIAKYLNALGDRLVSAGPPELKDPVFEYSFTAVNLKEINAFALPGGPMFVHRGMFDAAEAEAEVVGVMAHELSHVLLRHGTANASKAQNPWLQMGQLAGAIGGAVVGGRTGATIAQGSQFGLGALLLRYSRDFEKQADLLGAQIMARAGYDPRALARMFETIERETKGGGGGDTPQWLSSHPNPGNRSQYIVNEANTLTIAPAAADSEFEPMKTRFALLPPAKSMRDLKASGGNASAGAPPSVGTPGQPVPAPSTQLQDIDGKLFKAAVPSNWTMLASKTAIKAVPQNGYGQLKGQTVQTHGVEFGIAKAGSRDLKEATNAWLTLITEGNPGLRAAGAQYETQISQRTALVTPLVNPSPLGGEEHVTIHTTFLRDGNLFYYLTIVPGTEAETFSGAFRRIGESIRLAEAR